MRISFLSFQDLNLDSTLLRGIEAGGFTTPTEIQRQAIPVALTGQDLMASAQTGTGKTAAFVLPALQILLKPPAVLGRGPRVLVLTPTRELATQVTNSIKTLGRFTGLRAGSIVGGESYIPQERLLRSPLDLLVATPGRLIDHMARDRVDFSRLEILILDEADRMLDMGFLEDVERIAAAAPHGRQTLLFSATLEGAVNDIARRLLKNPARIQLAANKARHDSITQHVHQADDFRHKQQLLNHLLGAEDMTQAIIFTATKRSAEELAANLEADGHACAPLHGDMPQGARRRTIDALRRGRFRILVATDVAARGLDVKGLSHVINFDLPMVAEDYIHRIGRTGRGGDTGTAVSLVGPLDWGKLAGIERLTGQRIERTVIPGLEPSRPEPRKDNAKRGFQGKRKPGGPGAGAGKFHGNASNGHKATTGRYGEGRKDFGHSSGGHAAGGQRKQQARG